MNEIKKVLKKIISRPVLVTLALLFQIAWLLTILYAISQYYAIVDFVLRITSVLVVAGIINRNYNTNIKLAWIIPILAFPLLGGVLFLVTGGKLPTKKTSEKMQKIVEKSHSYLPEQEGEALQKVEQVNPYIASELRYLDRLYYPAYENTTAKYYGFGQEMFPDFLEDLRNAKSFIFLEYFIIKEGSVWEEIHEILKERADAGVDIRIIYDDIGSMNDLPDDFAKKRIHEGISCYAFNRFVPIYSIVMNNRDHRKIAIIDGEVGYTGGINLADEYMNRIERFGVWKDAAVRIQGEAVRGLTLMFLSMWEFVSKDEQQDIEYYMPKMRDYCQGPLKESADIVVPYGHSPYDNEQVAENVYINIINSAKRYLYIYTPYLGLDERFQKALISAAKRGVYVCMVTPEIPDKKMVYQLTKSEYHELLKGGVHIKQYVPGFVHAKCFVSDDEVAVVGSVNLDYRSLYHHFEDGILFYGGDVISQIKQDFEKTFEDCREIHHGIHKVLIIDELFYALLRLFSPLL